MKMMHFTLGVAAALAAAGCATRDPMPFSSGKDCFYPACSLNVEVVDDGRGGKRLQVEAEGNLRMGTRHRLVGIVWNLRTPGYEFRFDSIVPHTSRRTPGVPSTPYGVWSSQILPNEYWYDNISVTNMNNEPGMMFYDITVYPATYTDGQPLTFVAAIANDAWQGRESGWVMMK